VALGFGFVNKTVATMKRPLLKVSSKATTTKASSKVTKVPSIKKKSEPYEPVQIEFHSKLRICASGSYDSAYSVIGSRVKNFFSSQHGLSSSRPAVAMASPLISMEALSEPEIYENILIRTPAGSIDPYYSVSEGRHKSLGSQHRADWQLPSNEKNRRIKITGNVSFRRGEEMIISNLVSQLVLTPSDSLAANCWHADVHYDPQMLRALSIPILEES
jgi:hypothetical protein